MDSEGLGGRPFTVSPPYLALVPPESPSHGLVISGARLVSTSGPLVDHSRPLHTTSDTTSHHFTPLQTSSDHFLTSSDLPPCRFCYKNQWFFNDFTFSLFRPREHFWSPKGIQKHPKVAPRAPNRLQKCPQDLHKKAGAGGRGEAIGSAPF